jgi:hypothetical protein
VIPLLGFTPDLDPTTPGAMFEVENMVPTLTGMSPARQLVDENLFTGVITGITNAFIGSDPFSKTIVIADFKIYEKVNNAYVQNTSIAGIFFGDAQLLPFGQIGILRIGFDVYTYTPNVFALGVITRISGAPFGSSIAVLNGFVFIFGTGAAQTGWACSDQYNHLEWSPSPSNQAKTGSLIDTFGGIVSAYPLGENIIVYKSNRMYIGRNIGPPFVWDFDLLPYEVGLQTKDTLKGTQNGHYFCGREGVYFYDGGGVQNISQSLTKHLGNSTFNPKSAVYFPIARALYINGISNGIGSVFSYIYNTVSNKWGVANYRITHAALNATLSNSTQFEEMICCESEAFGNSTSKITRLALNNFAMTSSFKSNLFGDESGSTECEKVQLRFTDKPDTATATGYVNDGEGDVFVQQETNTLTNNKFDIRQSGHFHQFKFNMSGKFEVTHIRPALQPDGERE